MHNELRCLLSKYFRWAEFNWHEGCLPMVLIRWYHWNSLLESIRQFQEKIRQFKPGNEEKSKPFQSVCVIEWSLICIQVRRRGKKSNRTISNGIRNESRSHSIVCSPYLCIIFSLGVMLIRNLTCLRFSRLFFGVCCVAFVSALYTHSLTYFTYKIVSRSPGKRTLSIQYTTYALNHIWINFQRLNFSC